MRTALPPYVRALGLAVLLSGPIVGLSGCADENPPIGSISAPRNAPKDPEKPAVSAKKGGDGKAGQGVKERLGLDSK